MPRRHEVDDRECGPSRVGVDREISGHVHAPGVGGRRNVGERPAHGLQARPVRREREAQPPLAHGPPAAVPFQSAETEERLRILLPVRFEPFQRAREGVVHFGRLHLGIDEQLFGPLLFVSCRGESRAQIVAKSLEGRRREREAERGGVTSELGRVAPCHGCEPRKERRLSVRSPAARHDVPFAGEEKHGTRQLLRDARGGNPEHAAVPAVGRVSRFHDDRVASRVEATRKSR